MMVDLAVDVPIVSVIAAAALLLWTFARTAMIDKKTVKNHQHGANTRLSHHKKKRRPTNRPIGWSKVFPGRTGTAVVVIDVNNVRGIEGFQSGDVTAFCECAKMWAEEIAQYSIAATSGTCQLRVLLAVDHGPNEAVFDLPNQTRSAEVVVSFAGDMLTADDTIVETVEWFLQEKQWRRLTDQSDESNHQLLVVTNDRELRNRCYEAAVHAKRNNRFGMLKSVVFSDWLERGIWQKYHDRQRERRQCVPPKQANKYETTRQREHQAQALFEQLEQTTVQVPKAAPPSLSSWLWPREIAFAFQFWHETKTAAQNEKKESSTSLIKLLIEEWLEMKERKSRQRKAGEEHVLLNKLKSHQERKTKILEEVTEKMKRTYVAMDCEMVGIDKHGDKSALARVSIVDWNLDTVLDTHVKVPVLVTDYRTIFSGIQPHHIDETSKALDFDDCQRLVASILKDKVLVGHGLVNDLTALQMDHPRSSIRDTTRYKPFQRENPAKRKRYRARRLRDLVRENIPGRESFQQSSHDSLDDARAVMELYQIVWKAWEAQVAKKANAAGVL